jgi:hypothetical protein
MTSIYILTVSNEENSGEWYFPTQEKATNFIKDNFSFDNPRKISSELYQGKINNYVIDNQVIDQLKTM